MFGSKNFFFYQSAESMSKHRLSVVVSLKLKQRSRVDRLKYLYAFDFFCQNPNKYDGATIIKDLVDIRYQKYYLDLDAMLHDYEYIKGANRNYIRKWFSDLRYIKNMELNGKGVRYVRFVFLTIFASYLPIYKLFKKD